MLSRTRELKYKTSKLYNEAEQMLKTTILSIEEALFTEQTFTSILLPQGLMG